MTSQVNRTNFIFDSQLPREKKLLSFPLGKIILRIENYSARRKTPEKSEILRRVVNRIIDQTEFTAVDVARLLGISSCQFNTCRKSPRADDEFGKMLCMLKATVQNWPSGQYRRSVFLLKDLNEWSLQYGDKYVDLYLMTKVPKGKR